MLNEKQVDLINKINATLDIINEKVKKLIEQSNPDAKESEIDLYQRGLLHKLNMNELNLDDLITFMTEINNLTTATIKGMTTSLMQIFPNDFNAIRNYLIALSDKNPQLRHYIKSLAIRSKDQPEKKQEIKVLAPSEVATINNNIRIIRDGVIKITRGKCDLDKFKKDGKKLIRNVDTTTDLKDLKDLESNISIIGNLDVTSGTETKSLAQIYKKHFDAIKGAVAKVEQQQNKANSISTESFINLNSLADAEPADVNYKIIHPEQTSQDKKETETSQDKKETETSQDQDEPEQNAFVGGSEQSQGKGGTKQRKHESKKWKLPEWLTIKRVAVGGTCLALLFGSLLMIKTCASNTNSNIEEETSVEFPYDLPPVPGTDLPPEDDIPPEPETVTPPPPTTETKKPPQTTPKKNAFEEGTENLKKKVKEKEVPTIQIGDGDYDDQEAINYALSELKKYSQNSNRK